MIGKRRWLFLVVPLGAAALVGAAVSYQNRPLLQHAARIGAGKGVTAYSWRAPSELVILAPAPNRMVGQQPVAQWRVTRVNPASSANTPIDLPHLNEQDAPNPDTAIVSPDGQWLLYGTQYAYEDRWQASHFYCIRLDGAQMAHWRPRDEFEWEHLLRPAWMPDSRRWLELLPAKPGKTFLHSLDTDERRPIKVEGAPFCSALIGVTPDYRVIAISEAANQGLNTSTVELVDFGIHPNTEPTRIVRLKATPGGTIRELALSPRGDRLAWLVGVTHYPPGYGFLSRRWPALAKRIHPSKGTELRISRLGGRDSRLLGFQPSDPKQLGHDSIWGVQWRPDGKAVSFASASQLYQVPID